MRIWVALAVALLAAGACLRVPDGVRPQVVQHDGEHGSATSVGISAEWDMGSRRAAREATLDRLAESARQEAASASETTSLAAALAESRDEAADLREQLRAHHDEGALDQSDLAIGGGLGSLVLLLGEMLRRERRKG